MTPILLFLVGHWYLSAFCQTFFLHRYASHRMFSMPLFWERFFYALTFLTQGTSYLRSCTACTTPTATPRRTLIRRFFSARLCR